MKILTICSNEYPAPPPENAIHASIYISSVLAEGLARRGHHVTYVCAQGSLVRTDKVFPQTKPFFEIIKKEEWDNLPDMRLRAQLIFPFEIDLHLKLLETLKLGKFDLVHFHSTPPFLGLPFARRTNLPNIFTLHGGATSLEQRIMETFNSQNNYFISISNHQRKEFPNLKFFETIYHGIDLDKWRFEEKGGKEMVLTSRLVKEKGVAEAIKVAREVKRRLLISGDIRASQKEYFYNTIMPMINESKGLVKFLHFVNRSIINQFFSKGKLFLFPIQWEEPFGLVMIEAMASGTPVVTFARGSVPEVVRDGETGFIVNPSDDDIRGKWIIKKTGIEGICEAVERIYSMTGGEYRQMRQACRKHVEENFTIEKMVENYEKVYQKILR